jgi:hypothetical protein
VDRQGPLLNLDAVEVLAEFPQQRVRVKGFLSDRSRMVRFLLVGRRMPLPLEREWEFREEVALMASLTAILFEAQDAAGNVTRGEIALTLTSNDPPRIQKGEPGLPWLPRWAFLNPSATVSDFPTVRAGPIRTAQGSGRTPPMIKLTEHMSVVLLHGNYAAHRLPSIRTRSSGSIGFRESFEMDLPMSYGLGLSARLSDRWMLSLGVSRIHWSQLRLEES